MTWGPNHGGSHGWSFREGQAFGDLSGGETSAENLSKMA